MIVLTCGTHAKYRNAVYNALVNKSFFNIPGINQVVDCVWPLF